VFKLAISREAKNITKDIAVNVWKNLFFPVVFQNYKI